ncbi:beta-ketoacyl synthase N-terminal-like domain-containing protein [Enhygromyxa salina]|uniref:peptidylprolyl isomerase n=1 Tax=Enhygromyxa salina TaxID=215803 RepID=A0A2S9YW74_9BACT|nr:beta-ketoacyl synthase N-terminal-like domain-containing protein [Enhygromyxa salina]PRQ09347.1 Phthiocerol/phenolphthiocerol synthesis polyketide synthase type I PpsA [Enhygromyxa salina]
MTDYEPIAIVGRSCVLPGALTPEQLWSLVIEGRSMVESIDAVDPGRWRLAGADVRGEGPDQTWSDRGGYVRGFESVWDPEGFAVPAAQLSGLDPLFWWVLHCAREALSDAGDARRGEVARPRVGAIFGNLGFPMAQMSRHAESVWFGEGDGPVDPRNRFMSSAAKLLERALGLAPGVFCLDTACASSLVAIKLACDQLHDRQVDLALAGAVNRADDLFLHVGFCALSALSRSGRSRPFHADADGLLPAEGAGFVALKRLADARRDGDHVYGVIRGVGLSNDGRGRGFLAPAQAGQVRALRQAYALAGVDPSEVSLLECHATGTVVGDATELRSSAEVFADRKLSGPLPIGSLKSNLGHAITAAGVAGLIKVLEAMRHEQRPPTLHIDAAALNPTLADTPFRVLDRAEPWPEGAPKIAGVSAFGFGGNNAHLVVSEDDPTLVGDGGTWAPEPEEPLAVIGVGAVVGSAHDADAFTRVLLGEHELDRQTGSFTLELAGLRSPPNDLRDTLAQQLLVLAAAREASVGLEAQLSHDRSGVFMGIEPDPEICRHGARWRLAQRLRDAGLDPDGQRDWIASAGEALVGPLSAAGVVGTMPNIPANRINAQLDLGGHSCTVFDGEFSGARALSLASRALRSGELDTAVVCAVDLSCQEVHTRALAAVEGRDSDPGDAAVAFVVQRLSVARRAGARVLAVLERDAGDGQLALGELGLRARLGRSWAAGDLRDLCAAVLAGRRGALPDARPWSAPRQMRVEGPPGSAALLLRPQLAAPGLTMFAGADAAELERALVSGRAGGDGPCRAVIVASNRSEHARRVDRAVRHLRDGGPTGPGVFIRRAPIHGELALVFNGAGAAYEGMAQPLLNALPSLGRELAARSPALAAAYEAAWIDVEPLQQLWASSFVSQLHARLSTELLGLRPSAVIGYSSGESNSLFATGIWTDHDAMVAACRDSGVFIEQIGGALQAVERAWGSSAPAWETWTVVAPISEIEAAVEPEPRVHLSVIHHDGEGIVAGDPEGCARVRARLGAARCLRLHYDLAVHVPELAQIRETWLDLHRWPVAAREDLRVYSCAHAGPYTPSTEACAAAILGQADRRLDFRAVIERAYADGVRVFVEQGPQGGCSRWIREILGPRDAVIVALDRKGGGVEVIIEAAAALLAAGVDCSIDALLERPQARASSGHALQFEAHPPAVSVPLPTTPQAPPRRSLGRDENDNMSASQPIQIMVPAPTLPPVGAEPPPALPHVPAPSPASTPAPSSSFAASVMQAQLAELGQAQRAFIENQASLHQQFLALHEQSMELLAAAARTRSGGTVPGSEPVAPEPMRQQPAPVGAEPPRQPAPVAVEPPRPQPAPVQRSAAPPASASPPPSRPQPNAPEATGPRTPIGPTFDRAALEIHASGRISDILGPAFAGQDQFERQVRMPEPPLLLADRVTGLDAEPMSMKLGTIWTETDVRADAWYLHDGHMPGGIMIESGQADLLLISYLGVDAENRSDRVYRLLGCTLTYHGGLPRIGETLAFDIHLDGHAKQGGTRLMFFHYDCHIDGALRLSVRKGQAGFFTDAELAASDGCLWRPEDQEIVAEPRLDPPALRCEHASLSAAQLQAFADGRPWDCFGSAWSWAKTHTRTPRIQAGRMLFLDSVERIEARGGPWERGYLSATTAITPDHWFFDGHFYNDPCMPGTLMFDGCLQAMSVFLASLGFTVRRDGWRFEPVQGEPFLLSCRGQVTPKARQLRYEVFVEEVIAGPIPTVYADLLCTVDGLKAFHARRVGLSLVPGWPLDEGHPLLEAGTVATTGPIAKAGEFAFDYRSMLACAQGRPTHAFGPVYARFDSAESVARLPNPPYHFISRAVRVDGPIGEARSGARVEVEYDIPASAWYLAENGDRSVPFAVLLEAALQPCGWLASYMGCALASTDSLMFRNLDGSGTLHAELLLRSQAEHATTLTTRVTNTSLSKTASMIIVGFEVECRLGEALIYSMTTVFGFFPAAAFENQAGLPTTSDQRELLELPSTRSWALDGGKPTPGRARMARPMLLMLDHVTAFDPEGGAAGLGFARAEKRVDPDEWFFKAHFFQDPVQPGSLGIEAMLQLLQWTMLELGMDAGMQAPRFEAIAVDQAITWKYRGQVVPSNKLIQTTLEITARDDDERGAIAFATASLWVDGKRIYEASNVAMRIVDDEAAPIGSGRTITLDPARDNWLRDHCPTWTVPALPMMSMVDLLAQATRADERLIGLRDVRIKGWLVLDEARQLRVERDRERVELRVIEADGSEREVASGRLVIARRYGERPTPLEPLTGDPVELPYANGQLFHGPAFQLLEQLVRTTDGASSIVRVESEVPRGVLAPALLDVATHGIPHDRLTEWTWPGGQPPSADKVAYPAWIPEIDLYGPTPDAGQLRCEVRPVGTVGSPDFPAFEIQLIGDKGVWCRMRLVEACFPKGQLGSAAPLDRRAFLRDHEPVAGLSLARTGPDKTTLALADLDASDWLPGTVAGIYGTRDPQAVARKEHIAAAHALHPKQLPEALPLTRFELSTQVHEGEVSVSGAGIGELDITPVREFWTQWFARDPWPVEDLYYGLIERFVRRVVIEDPAAFAQIQGRSTMFLANHQVGVESLLFSVIASALAKVPTVTLAKIEHKHTWLGRLIAHCFSYPNVRDPGLITFFDREDKSSLMTVIGELAAEMRGVGRSVMVHVEGTRSLSCATGVQKMSGAFLDMAIAVGAPVVPVRFVGGLPVEPLNDRLEFPVGMGRQDIWIGRPFMPEFLASMTYGDRRNLVVKAINAVGPANEDERPLPGDPAFAAEVQQWEAARGVEGPHATLYRMLANLEEPGESVRRLLSVERAEQLAGDDSAEGQWLLELGRRLLG